MEPAFSQNYANAVYSFPSNGFFTQSQAFSHWSTDCRRVLRKTKKPFTENPKLPRRAHQETFSLMTDLYEVAAKKDEETMPLFMKETLPGEGTALVLSPERVVTEIKPKPEKDKEPVNLSYVFGHNSIQNKKISYGSE